MDRRKFLKLSSLSLTAASMPWLNACATTKTSNTAQPSQRQTHFQSHAMNKYFEENFGITPELLNKILTQAMSKGAQWADLFFEHANSISIVLQDGIINQASSSINLGMGARAVLEDQIGYAYTEELTPEAMFNAAKKAAIIANGTPNKFSPLPPNDFKHYYTQQNIWENPNLQPILDLLTSIDKKTRTASPLVEKVMISLAASQQHIMITSSNGPLAYDNQPMTRLYITVTMNKDGLRQTNSTNIAARAGMELYSTQKIDEIITDLIQRTEILYESTKPKAGDMPVVLSAGASGILLHEAIGHGMEADFNRKKTSIFSDLMNKQVASKEVNIIDSGLHDNLRGSLNVDDEGTPVQETHLVENGILRSYLHDKISASLYNTTPTGSARRQSFKHPPLPRMRTTYMTNGTHTPEELLENIEYGIYCSNFLNGQVNIGAGDYTFYVKNGFLIEKGKLTAPIKDVNIIGNGPDSLSKITKVANDFKMHEGGWTCGKNGQYVPVSLGMPSVLVSSITVGGI